MVGGVLPLAYVPLLSVFVFTSRDHNLPVRHVPDWVPGTGWKRRANIIKKDVLEMVHVPHQMVKEQVVRVLLAAIKYDVNAGFSDYSETARPKLLLRPTCWKNPALSSLSRRT